MYKLSAALSRLTIHRGKTIPVSTQIMTNPFAKDDKAEAIWALITVKVEVKTQVKIITKMSQRCSGCIFKCVRVGMWVTCGQVPGEEAIPFV